MRIATILVSVSLLGATAASAQTARTTPVACDALRQLQVAAVALTVSKTEWFAAGARLPGRAGGPPPASSNLPAYCRIDGVIDRRTGAGAATYGIGFALALPEEWNGRFLFQGGGGLNGSVQTPLGASAAGDRSALARGFAVVSTDTGHQGTGAFDGSFMQDQQANLDFAYVAVGRVADIAKRIIAQHYGKPPEHSYFAGCSTGGREAMLMAERYPLYFDGVIAGAPAMRTSYSGIGDRWVAATLNEIAPKNAQGQPVTRSALTDGEKKAVIDGSVNACDAIDGLKDGLIFDVNSCKFDPKTLVWSRLFLVPGASDCGGGPSLDTFDGLSAMVRWVEQGSAPASLTATGRAFPGRSRPLCAYSLHAQYKGQGNTEDAANFECR